MNHLANVINPISNRAFLSCHFILLIRQGWECCSHKSDFHVINFFKFYLFKAHPLHVVGKSVHICIWLIFVIGAFILKEKNLPEELNVAP